MKAAVIKKIKEIWYCAIYFALIFCVSCASDRPWCLERSTLIRNEAKKHYKAKIDNWAKEDIYLFDIKNIPDSTLKQMSYKGTDIGVHIFVIYTKCTTNESLVYNIAIDTTQCNVAQPKTIKEEAKIVNANYRRPIKENGICFVK